MIEGLARWGILIAYFVILLILTGYGAHRWHLVWLYHRYRRSRPRPARREESLVPLLTVQLPLFNELHVAQRLIDAVCELDYPKDRLEIQVLDDSTDETTDLVHRLVHERRAAGLDIVLLHRDDRSGFKAGALAAGLRRAKGEFVAIFDADFVPSPSFASRLMPYFADPGVGMVQARWGHLNAGYSALTRVQSLFLDGHFVIEHTARNRSGRFFNFNGTAGIWRKRCIEDAGGWQHDTLTEDLDLSYRAQMRGWKFVYVPEVVAPAELPVEMGAFKSQQHRWAKGSVETARKLLPRLLRSRLPWRIKLEAAVHLTGNVAYVLMLALAVLVVPAAWVRSGVASWQLAAIDLPIFALSSLSIAAFYATARREGGGSWGEILVGIPALMAVGIGLSVNNARAVVEAVRGRPSAFLRTPKYNLASGETLASRRYRSSIARDTWIELGLGLYFGAATTGAIAAGLWGAVPFLLLFEAGYLYTAFTTIAQGLGPARAGRARDQDVGTRS